MRFGSFEAAPGRLPCRALDNLSDPTLRAVGTLKASPNYHEEKWSCELHLLAVGAKKEDA
jgi:hypothetical protein